MCGKTPILLNTILKEVKLIFDKSEIISFASKSVFSPKNFKVKCKLFFLIGLTY